MPKTHNNQIKVVVVGAGKAGELISRNIAGAKESAFDIVGFVDDDKSKHGKAVNGIKVLGGVEDLRVLVPKLGIEEVFIALPSERGRAIRNVIEKTIGLSVVYKILPRLSEVLIQDYDEDYLRYVRRVRPEDLLGGEILKSDQEDISEYASKQVIMITGAAGSIGSELSRQIVAHHPKKVILYDWWENGMFDLRNQIIEVDDEVEVEYIIGDIKDRKKLDQVMMLFKPTTVFHAAAYKHVPLMESNPAEAIKNNILGTRTVGELAIKHHVEKFVLISTDKAVNPTNIMGATKRAAEQLIYILAKSQSDTVFCAVRFGNVINSNGSAIPFFENQIEHGGPVTLTHPEITRFFMTITEAVELILQAWVMGENNDLFVLDMGEPIKIHDLVRLLIALHGYEPDKDIQIKIVGLRPGEKIYEEVLVDEENTSATSIKKIFRTKNHMNFDKLVFIHDLNLLIDSLGVEGLNTRHIKDRMKQIISTYTPDE